MGYLIMGEIKDREHEKRGIEQKKTPTISFSILPKKDTNSTEHICSKINEGRHPIRRCLDTRYASQTEQKERFYQNYPGATYKPVKLTTTNNII